MHSRLPVPFWFYQLPKRSLLPRSCLFGFPGYQRGASKSLLRSIPEFPSCLRYRRSAPKDPSPSTLWACVDITVWYSARIFQSPANFNIMDTSPLASIVSQTPKINSKSVGNKTFLPYLQRLMYSVRDAIRTRDLPLRRRTLYPAELRKHVTAACLFAFADSYKSIISTVQWCYYNAFSAISVL